MKVKMHDIKRLQRISRSESGMLTIEGRTTTPRKMLAACKYWWGRSELFPETAEMEPGVMGRGNHDCTIFVDHEILGGLYLAERWKMRLAS